MPQCYCLTIHLDGDAHPVTVIHLDPGTTYGEAIRRSATIHGAFRDAGVPMSALVFTDEDAEALYGGWAMRPVSV